MGVGEQGLHGLRKSRFRKSKCHVLGRKNTGFGWYTRWLREVRSERQGRAGSARQVPASFPGRAPGHMRFSAQTTAGVVYYHLEVNSEASKSSGHTSLYICLLRKAVRS